MDAVGEHGELARFVIKGKSGQRLAKLTRRECDRIVRRLESLSEAPPEGVNDPFANIALLLEEAELPVDIDRLDRLMTRVPYAQDERRRVLYRVLARLYRRDALERFMQIVVKHRDDPALDELDISLLGYVREPRLVDVLFPRLSCLLEREDCAAAVMEVANAFKVGPHPLATSADVLLRLLSAKDNDVRAAAAWTLGSIGDSRAVPALLPIAESGGRSGMEAAQSLLRLGNQRGGELLSVCCGDARVRWRARAYLKEVKAEAFIPEAARHPDLIAEDELRQWLEFPTEYGQPPEAIELIDGSRRNWPGKGPTQCWLFRCRKRAEDAWDVGIVGPTTFVLFGKQLADLPIEQMYQHYENWQSDPKRGAPAMRDLAERVYDDTSKHV